MHIANFSSVSREDLRLFRTSDPDSESGYRGVYRKQSGGPGRERWVAKAFSTTVSPACDTPAEAARHLAAYWKDIYGDDWKRLYRGTTANGAGRRYRYRLIHGKGGFWVAVVVVPTRSNCGAVRTRHALSMRTNLPHPPGLWYVRKSKTGKRGRVGWVYTSESHDAEPDYRTVEEADAAYRKWIRLRFGLLAWERTNGSGPHCVWGGR